MRKSSDIGVSCKADVYNEILNGVTSEQYVEISKSFGNCKLRGELIPGLIEDTACIVIEIGVEQYVVKINSDCASAYVASDEDFPIAIISYDSVSSSSEFYSELAKSINRYSGN